MTVCKNSKMGMTLVELIISSVVTVIVIGAACSVLYFGYSNYTSGTTDLSNHQNASLLEDYLQHDLSTATSVTVTSGAEQSAVNSGVGVQSANDKIISMHFNSDKILVIAEKGGTSVNISGIESITLTAAIVNSASSSSSSVGASAKLTYVIQANDKVQKRSFVLTGGIVLNNYADHSVDTSLASFVIPDSDTTRYLNIQMPDSSASSITSGT